jgi:plasmid stabilization system protein ParE
LKQRRVRFTATAQRHVTREKVWWLENRIYKDIFADELDEAVKLIALMPGAGAPYAAAGSPGLRRVYLPRVALHLYYTFDDREVIVRALWGARCGSRPQIGSA